MLLQNPGKIGDMKKYIVVILSLFVVLFANAQKKVHIELTPKNAEIGETFNITITSSVPGNLNFDNVPDLFIQDYNVQRGSKKSIDHVSGTIRAEYYYTFTGMMTKAGQYNFGPVFITNGNKTHSSNKATITIGEKVQMQPGEVSSNQLQDPAFGIIQTNKKTIYEGAPLLVSCKIYAQYDPTHVGAYKSYTVPRSNRKHSIGNNATTIKHHIERFKGREYYTFDYDKNIIFPSRIGTFHIQPFSLNLHQGYESFPVVSGDIEIEVLPLPENPPSDFIGGVGKFSIESNLNSKTIKQGEVFNLKVKISGSGNLHNISAPELKLPDGFTVYGDPIINERYSIDINGAEGEIEYEYNVQAKNAGITELPETSISYFDPNKEKYIQSRTKEQKLNVVEDINFIAAQENDKTIKNKDLVVHRSEIRNIISIVKNNSLFGTTIFWSSLTLPFLASFFLLFLTKKRSQIDENIKNKQQRNEQLAQLKKHIEKAKSNSTTGADQQFYPHIENALIKAFEIKMNRYGEQSREKQEILEYIDDQERQEKIRSIFASCDQAKYGFSPDKASRLETLNNLKAVIHNLNIIKW